MIYITNVHSGGGGQITWTARRILLVWSTLTWRLQRSRDYVRPWFLGPGFRIRTTVMFFFFTLYFIIITESLQNAYLSTSTCFRGRSPKMCARVNNAPRECHIIRFWRVWKQPKSENRKTVFRTIINMYTRTWEVVVFHERLYYISTSKTFQPGHVYTIQRVYNYYIISLCTYYNRNISENGKKNS